MSLTSVKMAEDVWLTCLTHALSTETEEIMGLLLGDIQHSKNGSVTALIWGALPQPRSDRQKDRVETNPEQLTAASVQAEKMTVETGRTTRVIGWYHSHPHITVLPSHVDVRTQAMYQLLDSGFIGLIFSCFNEDQYKVGRIQVTAFQSLDGKQSNALRAVPLSPINKSSIIDLESSLSTDNSLTTSGSTRLEGLEHDTGDSRAAAGSSKVGGKSSALKGLFANADTNYTSSSNIESSIVDIDPMDMSESMQEAMHRSNLEMSGAEYVRKEVPLHVLPTLSLLNLESPLKSFTDLQSMLYEEEKTAYHQAILQNMRDGKVHPLSFIHHTSTYQASICKLMEYWFPKLGNSSSVVESQAAKRQKLDRGHLCKGTDTNQQANFVHKAPKREVNVQDHIGHGRLRITVPKSPDLATAQRAQRIRQKETSENEHVASRVPRFQARPLNRKIFETPSFLHQKSSPRVPEFQEFHLKTSERAVQNAAAVPSTSSFCNNSKEPQKPSFAFGIGKISREPKGPSFTSSAKQEDCDAIHRFKALPLNNKILSSKGGIGVFRNQAHVPPVDLFNKVLTYFVILIKQKEEVLILKERKGQDGTH